MEEFDDPKKTLEHYVLTILGKIILLEERQTRRMSSLRVFCRLDVSVFRERSTGNHSFFVNEVTRTHGAGLFQFWSDHDNVDTFFQHLKDVLHLVASRKLFHVTPTPP